MFGNATMRELFETSEEYVTVLVPIRRAHYEFMTSVVGGRETFLAVVGWLHGCDFSMPQARVLVGRLVPQAQGRESAWKAGHQAQLAQSVRDAPSRRFQLVVAWALDRLSRLRPTEET